MNKKFLLSLILMFLAYNASFAIENEYKNSLTKIELSKKDDNSYNIDLYTQKRYQEPVKIIKKSDLNYYILLPETKNSVTKAGDSLQDIKSISTNTYFYAGQETKNGYTKININTSKPLNFNVTVKSATNEKSLGNNIEKAQEKLSSIPMPQKKNLINESKKQNLPQNREVKTKEVKKNQVNKTQQKTIKKDIVSSEKKQAQRPKEIVLDSSKPLDLMNIDNNIQEESSIEETEESYNEKSNVSEEIVEEFEQFIKDEDAAVLQEQSIVEKYLAKIYSKILPYKKHFKCLVLGMFILIASILSVILIFTIKSRKKENKSETSNNYLTPYSIKNNHNDKKEKVENNGQYFVFDNQVAQNNFYNPNHIRKNYELSSYEPDLQMNYKKQKEYQKTKENDYDIIQKILKEDAIVEYEPNELKKINQTNEVQNPLKEKSQSKEIQAKTQQNKEEIGSPVVLSSVEIAPERGFMCVSYNNNINLIGYIFDDVFALHNFKQPKLENYDIKYRLSDKDEKGANFIVKVENSKMLIRVTKSFMSMEVLM